MIISLFEADDAGDDGEAEDVVDGDGDGGIVFVVGNGNDTVGMVALLYAFDEEALFTGGNDVGLVPLDKVAFIDAFAADNVLVAVLGIHGVAFDVDHEIGL